MVQGKRHTAERALSALGATLSERTPKIAAESEPPAGIQNVILVHGAFADGSGGQAVAKILEKDDYTVSVLQIP